VTATAGGSVTDGAAIVRRIWERDPDLWKPGDAGHATVIRNRLGWLDSPLSMRERAAELSAFAEEVRVAGIRDCVLLGMGGSSLCPEVLRTSIGSARGFPTLHVLDTTDPDAIIDLARRLDDNRTLFLVASKSGKTLETLSHLAHFWEELNRVGVADPGSHFVAITDPGTSLAATARERGFRRVFENPPDIGGRYSALTYFGLVPAAVMGIDVAQFLDRALEMRERCSRETLPEENPGLALGTTMSTRHAEGRDKVTILAPPRIAAFSLWAEQLIAESTGKEGKGYIPIGSEPLGAPEVYGGDRLFVALRVGGEALDTTPLEAAGQPVVHLDLRDVHDLGAEFFRWEMATAVAAVSLGIDPFDEPNVQESKDNTNRVLADFEKDGSFPTHEPAAVREGVRVYSRLEGESPEAVLLEYISRLKQGDYVALMAYVDPTAEHEEALQGLRVAIRDRQRVATTLGFGPRFLHSTGQLHKGGPATGRYIQITTTERSDVDIPGQPFGFSILLRAQAQGDLESLRAHGRPVIRIHIDRDLAGSLRRLTEAVRAATVEPVS
jgi:glucose-6-phosphate isomerase